jgi:SAM-dependent methyltransferase
MTQNEIKLRLNELTGNTPWAHLIELAPGLFTVTEADEVFYKKAFGLKKIGTLLTQLAAQQVHGHTLHGKRVLDLACGEGGHSLQMAALGAQVLGIEGRSQYVERAQFAAEATGCTNVEFRLGDVRQLDPEIGTFDVVIFSGILHHLGLDDFDGMINELARVTGDLLLVYTHVSTDISINNHRLTGPVKTASGREGYLFREHGDGATDRQKEQQVRASLDNTFSFWAKEEELISALVAAGFCSVLKAMAPHPFGWANASYRPILVARKK